ETITADGTLEGSGITLYANWLPKSTRYTMQTFTSAVCKNELTPVVVTREEVNNETVTNFTASPNSFIALEDERDGNVYAVGRFPMGADGSNSACWMIENMRINNTATINNTNTNNPASGFALTATSDNWSISNANISHLNTNNTATPVTRMTGPKDTTNYTANIYSYGNYYNWYSATAGNGTGTNAVNNDSAVGSICPGNWRLPMGGSLSNKDNSIPDDNATNSDFYALGKSIIGVNIVDSIDQNLSNSSGHSYYSGKSNLFRTYPYNFIRSGRWLGSSVNSRGVIGDYWSSTVNNAEFSYVLDLGTSNVFPGAYSDYKVRGFAVRCLAGV
ncbi:hypothetical protein IKE79_01385, partial [Candidatus Saccharibacteria bacterium]|nr:hypothetical protein [Candidatus Saccharibacteria bacterium]